MRTHPETLSRTAGEGGERSETGEGEATQEPSPTGRSRDRSPLSRGAGEGFAARLVLRCMTLSTVILAIGISSADADETAALYQASWAGLPAGELRLTLRDDPTAYRGEIVIRTEGLPRLLTRFRASAVSEGRLAAERLPAPMRCDAAFDLRKRRDRRLAMEFVRRADVLVADRGAGDTSKKP